MRGPSGREDALGMELHPLDRMRGVADAHHLAVVRRAVTASESGTRAVASEW